MTFGKTKVPCQFELLWFDSWWSYDHQAGWLSTYDDVGEYDVVPVFNNPSTELNPPVFPAPFNAWLLLVSMFLLVECPRWIR